MKKEIAKELLAIIQESRGGIREGINAAMDIAPDIIHELIIYGLWEEVTWLIFNGVIVCLLAWGIFAISKKERFCEDDADNKAAKIALTLIFSFISFMSLAFFVENFLDVLRIVVSPKLYLIDELSKMVVGPRSR